MPKYRLNSENIFNSSSKSDKIIMSIALLTFGWILPGLNLFLLYLVWTEK